MPESSFIPREELLSLAGRIKESVTLSEIQEAISLLPPAKPELLKLPLQILDTTISTFATLSAVHTAAWLLFGDHTPKTIAASLDAISTGRLSAVQIAPQSLEDLEFVVENLTCDLPELPDSLEDIPYIDPVQAIQRLREYLLTARYVPQSWPACKLLLYGLTRFNQRMIHNGLTLCEKILPVTASPAYQPATFFPVNYPNPHDTTQQLNPHSLLWLADLKLLRYVLREAGYIITYSTNPTLRSPYYTWSRKNPDRLVTKYLDEIKTHLNSPPYIDLPGFAVTISEFFSIMFRITRDSIWLATYPQLQHTLQFCLITDLYERR